MLSPERRTPPKQFLGRWRIIETDVWDQDALDLVVPAHMTFERGALGHFQMIAVEGGLDCRFDGNRVEFSWLGDDEGQPTGGRGWAELEPDGKLRGRLYFHQGDDTEFVANREEAPRPRRKRATLIRPRERGTRARAATMSPYPPSAISTILSRSSTNAWPGT